MPLLGGGRPDPGRLRTCGMLVVPGCSRSCPLSSPYSICASLTYIMDQAGAFPSVLDCIRPSALSKKNQNQSINHAGADAEHQHRPGHHEQLGRRSGDESLCLCQDRDERNFCPILLGFWLLKFLKKSAFFAKLL